MERLTYKSEVDGRWYFKDGIFCEGMARLAAYEDTGLLPEDFKKAFNEDALLKLTAQYLGTTPDHLRSLVEAEKALEGGKDGA